MKLLNQAVAIRKGVQSRVHDKTTELHKTLDKSVLFNGFQKQFRPLEDAGERFPDENQNVQLSATVVIGDMAKALTELIDIEATVDATNAVACADITVDGTVIAAKIPATTLLFLEKQMQLFRSDLKNIPELDPAESWTLDNALGVFVAPVQETTRSKKVQKPIVMYPATPEHPAQTQMTIEDVTIGHWRLTKQSGAMRKTDKATLLEKADKLLDAVKAAREQANTQEVVKMEVGSKLFSFLLG